MFSCVLPPEPREDEPRVPLSRTMGLTVQKPATQEDPWIQAQRLMERGEPRPQLVGAHTLKSWMGGRNLYLWDLSSERARTSYGSINNSLRIGNLQKAKEQAKNLKGTLVLIADESQEPFQRSVWKELRQQPSLRVVILSGGIEGWSRTFNKKP